MQQLYSQIQGREPLVPHMRRRPNDYLSKRFLANVDARMTFPPLNDNNVLQTEWPPEISKDAVKHSANINTAWK